MTATNTPSIEIAHREYKEDGLPGRHNRNFVTNAFVMTGLAGKIFGTFDWNVNYSYSKSKQQITNRGNVNAEKFGAALDAVVNPATGQVVCQVTLTASAGRFPGCVPLNLFGPTATDRKRLRIHHGRHAVHAHEPDARRELLGRRFSVLDLGRAGDGRTERRVPVAVAAQQKLGRTDRPPRLHRPASDQQLQSDGSGLPVRPHG